jgi:short subunit dehydrogenase-like uncharacterized protein
MSRKIVLFGATGYTGARIAEALVRRGLAPVLAGRNPDRLGSLARHLGGLPVARADAADSGSVRDLLDPRDVLISTVGPFQRFGAAAVRAAVDAGAVYFDTTGEPPFIRRVFDEYGPAAGDRGAALLTAFGNDFVPGTLAGALALTAAGTAAESVHTGYFLTGGAGRGFSRGTVQSVAGVLLEPMYRWQDGRLRDEPAGRRFRTFPVAGRPRPAVSIGAVEQFALPWLAATGVAPGLREVDVYLGWFGAASRAMHLSSSVLPLIGRVPQLARALGAGMAALAGRAPEEPSAAALAGTTSYFVGQAFAADRRLLASVTLRAPDAYSITAELVAWGAQQALADGVDGVGALDAVAAFGLDELVKGAEAAHIVRV